MSVMPLKEWLNSQGHNFLATRIPDSWYHPLMFLALTNEQLSFMLDIAPCERAFKYFTKVKKDIERAYPFPCKDHMIIPQSLNPSRFVSFGVIIRLVPQFLETNNDYSSQLDGSKAETESDVNDYFSDCTNNLPTIKHPQQPEHFSQSETVNTFLTGYRHECLNSERASGNALSSNKDKIQREMVYSTNIILIPCCKLIRLNYVVKNNSSAPHFGDVVIVTLEKLLEGTFIPRGVTIFRSNTKAEACESSSMSTINEEPDDCNPIPSVPRSSSCLDDQEDKRMAKNIFARNQKQTKSFQDSYCNLKTNHSKASLDFNLTTNPPIIKSERASGTKSAKDTYSHENNFTIFQRTPPKKQFITPKADLGRAPSGEPMLFDQAVFEEEDVVNTIKPLLSDNTNISNSSTNRSPHTYPFDTVVTVSPNGFSRKQGKGKEDDAELYSPFQMKQKGDTLTDERLFDVFPVSSDPQYSISDIIVAVKKNFKCHSLLFGRILLILKGYGIIMAYVDKAIAATTGIPLSLFCGREYLELPAFFWLQKSNYLKSGNYSYIENGKHRNEKCDVKPKRGDAISFTIVKLPKFHNESEPGSPRPDALVANYISVIQFGSDRLSEALSNTDEDDQASPTDITKPLFHQSSLLSVSPSQFISDQDNYLGIIYKLNGNNKEFGFIKCLCRSCGVPQQFSTISTGKDTIRTYDGIANGLEVFFRHELIKGSIGCSYNRTKDHGVASSASLMVGGVVVFRGAWAKSRPQAHDIYILKYNDVPILISNLMLAGEICIRHDTMTIANATQVYIPSALALFMKGQLKPYMDTLVKQMKHELYYILDPPPDLKVADKVSFIPCIDISTHLQGTLATAEIKDNFVLYAE